MLNNLQQLATSFRQRAQSSLARSEVPHHSLALDYDDEDSHPHGGARFLGQGDAASMSDVSSVGGSISELIGASSPLAVLLAGGRSVRMEGFLKEKTGFLWHTKFACLEEGRLRLSANDDEEEPAVSSWFEGSVTSSTPSKSEIINLVELEEIYYAKRGNSKFQLTTAKHTYRLKASCGDEAEAWIQHILQEVKNQAQLLTKCGEILAENTDSELPSNPHGLLHLLRHNVHMWTLANGEVHEKVAIALDNLVAHLNKYGKEAEADVLARRAKIIRAELENPNGLKIRPRTLEKTNNSGCNKLNSGLAEVQLWLQLQEKAEMGEDALSRTQQLREREQELMKLMSEQHETRLEELQNKAIQAEMRLKEAESELAKLRESKRESKQESKRRSISGSENHSETDDDDHADSKSSSSLRRKIKSTSRRLSEGLSKAVGKEIKSEALSQKSRRDRSGSGHPSRKHKGIKHDKELRKLRNRKRAQKASKKMSASLHRPVARDGKVKKSCFVVYSGSNDGCLYTVWSSEEVGNAVGQFLPGKRVSAPETPVDHREMLTSGYGGDDGVKMYCEGINQFLSLAYKFESPQIVLNEECPLPINVYLWNAFVRKIALGSAFSVLGANAIAVVPAEADVFQNTPRTSRSTFFKTASSLGSALELLQDRESLADSSVSDVDINL